MILRSILCPVDFSDESRHALRLAGALAARDQSRLVILNVVDPLLAEAAAARLKVNLAKDETEPALREFVKETWPGQAPVPQPVLEVHVGNSSAVIAKIAARDAVDLIVMGTHGLGGVRKWLLGSTTDHVLRSTRTPVLAVPPIAHASEVPFTAGAIVAATDFTKSSEVAVATAAEFAQTFDVPLLLAHVVADMAAPPQWREIVAETNVGRIADAKARLKLVAGQCPRAAEVVVSLGRPADQIAALADERKAGLIVMGLTGEQGLFTRRPGSVAYRVLCTAGVPVLIVPTLAPA